MSRPDAIAELRRPPEPKNAHLSFLDRFLNRFRGVSGQYIIPKNGGFDQIMEVLGRDRAVGRLESASRG